MNHGQVVDAPEILTVIGKVPYLSEFLNSLYDCQYKSFFSAFGEWRTYLYSDWLIIPPLLDHL